MSQRVHGRAQHLPAEDSEAARRQEVLYDGTHLAFQETVKTGSISITDDTKMPPRNEPKMLLH